MHHEQMQAARAVTRVLEGAQLRTALAEVDDGDASRGHTLVQELAYGTLRHLGRLEAIAGYLVRKPMPDALLRALVDVALYQLEETRAPAFAVVDRAVVAAGTLVRPQAKPLVNALLRSPIGRRDWPLRFYSAERLFSVEARRDFVDPNLAPLPTTYRKAINLLAEKR